MERLDGGRRHDARLVDLCLDELLLERRRKDTRSSFDLQSLTARDEAVTIGTGVAMDRRSGTFAADIGGGVAAYRAAATLLT